MYNGLKDKMYTVRFRAGNFRVSGDSCPDICPRLLTLDGDRDNEQHKYTRPENESIRGHKDASLGGLDGT